MTGNPYEVPTEVEDYSDHDERPSQGHTYESDRLSDDPNTGNSMLRERAVNQYNAKTYGKKNK